METEPEIEFIGINIIEGEGHGNYRFGKNPRTLHLPIVCSGHVQTLELYATRKFSISKKELIRFQLHPEESYNLNKKSLDILQGWLAARYRRQTLPGALDTRLTPIKDLLERQAKKYPLEIDGYWIQFDPEYELEQHEPYELKLMIVYSSSSSNAEEIALQISKNIYKLCEPLQGIDLKVFVFSGKEFTLDDITQYIEFRYDYISHRANMIPAQQTLEKSTALFNGQ